MYYSPAKVESDGMSRMKGEISFVISIQTAYKQSNTNYSPPEVGNGSDFKGRKEFT